MERVNSNASYLMLLSCCMMPCRVSALGGENGSGGSSFAPWRSSTESGDDVDGGQRGQRGRRRVTALACDAEAEVCIYHELCVHSPFYQVSIRCIALV